jgi:iron complex transport system substrate-binding protein
LSRDLNSVIRLKRAQLNRSGFLRGARSFESNAPVEGIMRICSLLPSGTEILFALGLGDSVMGVTSKCDYPPQARTKPIVVHSKLPSGLSEREIDRQVHELSASGQSLYQLDVEKLQTIQPDLIITQGLCHVCAASPDDLGSTLNTLSPPPTVLSLSPRTLEHVWDDIVTVGTATGRVAQARELVSTLVRQIANLRTTACGSPLRVLCLEWLDPPFVAGHWVPEMVTLAGGVDVLGPVGQPGFQVTWEAIAASDPDLILVMPCGYHQAEVERELSVVPFPGVWHALRAVRNKNVFAMDASSHFSRPGPRLAEGVVAMAQLFRRCHRSPATKAVPV